MTLSKAQQAALASVAELARARGEETRILLEHLCRMSDIAPSELDDVLRQLQRHARVAVHFHPDRPCASGETVAQGLLRDGCYRSQYETRISNGGLSAHLGGRRDVCEQQLFGGAYHAPGVPGAERPKYGCLQLLSHAEGPAPRFGSCYLLLSPAVSARCTFTHLDSHEDPRHVGTLAQLDTLVAAVLKDVFLRDSAFGLRDVTVASLLRRMRNEVALTPASQVRQPVRNLNYYIEAQVHGAIDLARDAEALVADPSFRGSETEEALQELCARYDVQLYWHHGFRLAATEVPRDFRGPSMPSLAGRVARSGFVDANAIGTAVRLLQADPAAWRDRGSFDEVLQELKLLWHVLVRYGQPMS